MAGVQLSCSSFLPISHHKLFTEVALVRFKSNCAMKIETYKPSSSMVVIGVTRFFVIAIVFYCMASFYSGGRLPFPVYLNNQT